MPSKRTPASRAAAKGKIKKITYTTLFADESLNPRFEEALRRFESKIGRRYPMYIGGKEVYSDAGEFEHRSPMDTSIVVGKFQIGTREHAKEAIDAAKEGFEAWSAKPWQDRVKVLDRYARLIDERKFDIAVAITYEVGKNRLEALAECWEAIDAVKYYSGVMRREKGYTTKMGPGGPGEHNQTVCKPHGVWPVISPFNFPFMLANGMAMGALAAVKAAKRTGIMITGMDANKDAVEAVKKGELAMTISLPPYDIGSLGVVYGRWLKTGEMSVPVLSVMPVKFITK
jgi:delta 1-pyrroline-5-carboxylate dehydrogenase